MLLEHLGGDVPLLHNVFVGDVESVEDQVQYLDVIARGVAFGIQELEGLEVPVTGDDKGFLLGVAEGVLGGNSEK
jgi:hypothetical protein